VPVVTNDHAVDERMLVHVERILRSECLRSSELLRQLLRFLAQKSAAGEADNLKEYVIAVDALGKPTTYDPGHDAAVRIQVGRLRQKLAEYYRTEGKDDTAVIDLPKGRFLLTCEPREQKKIKPSEPAKHRVEWTLVWVAAAMWLASIVTVAWAKYSSSRPPQKQAAPIADATTATPELDELWQPFISNERPLLLAVEDPLFVEFQRGSGIYYRDRGVNDWATYLGTPGISGLRKSLSQPDIQPSRYYTALGEVNTTLMIGRLLGKRDKSLSLVRTSELTWQDLADNNVLFVGMQVFFNAQLNSLPVRPQLVPGPLGVENLQPGRGQPAKFLDHYVTAPMEEGEVYALITRLPGPVGSGDIESFTSNRAAGYVAAVQWFTDPHFAPTVVSNLTSISGKMPAYYQVLLRVQFKDEVPTETAYVLGCALH
jgi:hypothetical protein